MREETTLPPPAPAPVPESRRMYWSIRRELWESRSIYLAAPAVAALFFVGFVISTAGMPERRRAVLLLNAAQQRAAILQPYNFGALAIMFVVSVVAVFYCLDALHGERRDRSILFWKSLPVSDWTTVLAKASIPLVVLPLVGFVVTVATQLLMLLWSSLVLLPSGLAATTWSRVDLPREALLLFYHLITVHSLWYAPIYGYLLFVSAWARRAAILWAALPLLAIGFFEKVAFNSTEFASLLRRRMEGGAEAVMAPGALPMDSMTHLTPLNFVASPGLWVGLAVAAAFLWGAVRLRRYRDPI